jgi:hypothetical protein
VGAGDPEDRPVIDVSDAESTDWMAASRKFRILGDDREEADETAWSLATHVVNRAEDEYGDTPATIPDSFKQHLSNGVAAPVIADIIADRITTDYGEKMSDDEQRRVRRLGNKAVIMAADTHLQQVENRLGVTERSHSLLHPVVALVDFRRVVPRFVEFLRCANCAVAEFHRISGDVEQTGDEQPANPK